MKNNKAFTLIELLVVIAVIGLLMSVLLPALRMAKAKAVTVVCMANQKSLINAWLMYEGDNDAHLVGGVISSYDDRSNASYRGGIIEEAGKYAWMHAPVRTDMSNAIDADLMRPDGIECRERGIELGKLWSYIESHDVYHCMGDMSRKNEPPYDTFVSYAVSATMNGEEHGWNGNVDVYTKSSHIRATAERMVFIEENPAEQTWLSGSFVLGNSGVANPKLIWVDYPAPWHNKKGTISFADGHAQTTEWESMKTHELVNLTKRIAFSPSGEYCLDNPDLYKIVKWYGGR